MTTGLLLGAALGAAVCLFIYAAAPPRPSLAATVAQWERARAHRAPRARGRGRERDDEDSGRRGAWGERFGSWLAATLTRRGIQMEKMRANLELADVPLETHLVRKCVLAGVGLLLPSLVTLVWYAAGITTSLTLPAGLGVLLAVVFFVIPDASVARQAEARRGELRRALSSYLDLVSMSLAGGRGIPEALPSSANIGTGWAFEKLQTTLEHARDLGDTPWQGFADLGERTGMTELVDLGRALALVSEDGAKIRASLTARAATQRRRQLAEAEGAAEQADQSIQIAQVVIAVGFILFIGFPAVMNVLTL